MAISLPPPVYPPYPGSLRHTPSREQLEEWKAECKVIDAQRHREKFSEGLPKARTVAAPHRRTLASCCVASFLAGWIAAMLLGS